MTDPTDPESPRPPGPANSPLSAEGQATVEKIKRFLATSRVIAYGITAVLVALKLLGRIDSGWLVVLSPLMLQILVSAAVTAWFGFVVAPREIDKMERRGPPDHSS